MRPLILSTSDLEGGAARSAYRLHTGMQSINISSQMLVRAKRSRNQAVKPLASLLTKLGPSSSNWPLKFYPKRKLDMFSVQWFPDAIASSVPQIAPDIVNVHWICNGFLQIETLKRLNLPIVWTLHDMWAFTGGCHYSKDCDRYKDKCGSCPQLGSNKANDLSRKTLKRKHKAWNNLEFTIVTPSMWLAKCVRESSLFRYSRVEVIPYGLDTNAYKPIDKKIARDLLGLPLNKQLILFLSLAATSDTRKGFHLLQPALQKLSQRQNESLEIMVVGASKPKNAPGFGLKSHFLGTFNDDLTLALAYSAADVFVAPSIQDNLPNTLLEAISCGTPCVAFNIGGIPDIIVHEQNGYLVQPYSSEDLARGISWILADSDRYQKLSNSARQRAEQNYSLDLQARRYFSLFEELIEQKKQLTA